MVQAVLLSGHKEVPLSSLHIQDNWKVASPRFKLSTLLSGRLVCGWREDMEARFGSHVGSAPVLVDLSDSPSEGRSLVVDRERDTQASLEHLTIVEGHPQLPFAAREHVIYNIDREPRRVVQDTNHLPV